MIRRGARGWLVAAGALLACAGCGFKGPLYLPERNAVVVTHPAQTPTPAAKKKGKTPPASQSPDSSTSPAAPAPPPQ